MKTFLALALMTFAAAAAGQSPAGAPILPETITVIGTGRTTLPPDHFSFSVGVQTVAPTVEEAVAENNRRVAAVTAALRDAGAEANAIRTTNFSISPQQDHTRGALRQILGYQVSNNVTLRSPNIDNAGKLLSAAVSAGANTSSGINFNVSDRTRGRDEGLRAAYNDARAKAALLAQAAGRQLGRPILITEGTQHVAPPVRRTAEGVAGGVVGGVVGAVPLEAGVQQMTYNVTVSFEVR